VITNALIVKVEHRQKPAKSGEAQYFPETVSIHCFFERKAKRLRTKERDEVMAQAHVLLPSKADVVVGDRVTLRPVLHSADVDGETYVVLDVSWVWGRPTKELYLEELA